MGNFFKLLIAVSCFATCLSASYYLLVVIPEEQKLQRLERKERGQQLDACLDKVTKDAANRDKYCIEAMKQFAESYLVDSTLSMENKRLKMLTAYNTCVEVRQRHGAT